MRNGEKKQVRNAGDARILRTQGGFRPGGRKGRERRGGSAAQEATHGDKPPLWSLQGRELVTVKRLSNPDPAALCTLETWSHGTVPGTDRTMRTSDRALPPDLTEGAVGVVTTLPSGS